ncbi:RPT1, ATP-dependent 26S proteasome regulatory subunit [Pyrenophora tritici-repentis]|nr:ATPase family associated protein [Pyrenophora tritici-repentis]PZC88762.1 RPT1, ATP-dependent 26S proteasome regulatory subunit [Pyrenophora tritici-repentis]PZD22779.1 RPT1, ATP-dependent 26S proteasome regulatory subunit [Pyrenophora tritici-repentis]PZD27285.1 RPT1, ATP-dependent 26S proteasome regulatory subunit [Pyrenophora tritici-repentis]
MSNPFGSDFDEVEHQREMIRKMNMRKLLQPKATATEQEPHKKQVTVTPPATFQSWVFGIMNGGQDSWLMRYMESEFYELARKAIKDRTGGDIHMVMMGCAALNAARVKIPAMLSVALTQVKSQVTSSIAISAYDSPLIKELFQIAREKSEEFQSLKLRLSGEHHLRKVSGELVPISGNSSGAFWHNGTYFTLELQGKSGEADEIAIATTLDPTSKLVVGCFGHSSDPIQALIEHAKTRVTQTGNLHVMEIIPNPGKEIADNRLVQRKKRPMSTVDLDPQMMQDILKDVELFFHKESQIWYEHTGRPWRHGYLLHGPPGTGKSSLITAIASHMNVFLCVINLQGMDDEDLKQCFDRVPPRSVVAIEDIDCVGADIGNRGAQPASSTVPASSVDGVGAQQSQAGSLDGVLAAFMEKQQVMNQQILKQDDEDQPFRAFSEKPRKPSGDKVESGNKSVTLSGLLNVLDGVNASEGRLVIMTTNHPEKLDPALYRAGRVERKFEISYASKDSCILTFKRLFGNDVCKRYTSEAIDRFAQAFQAQFPSKSRITTAELTKYCGQYRGRPDVAVEEFADWVKRGADKFVIPRDYAKAVDEEGVNIPEPFDSDLLLVRTSDLVDPNVGATSDMEVVTEVQPTAPASRGFFSAIANVFQDSGEYTDLASIQGALVNVDSDASLSEIPHGHLIETIPECELALMSPRPLPDDDDEFLYIV